MKTLGVSYLKFFTCTTKIQKEWLIRGSKDIGFLWINKRVRDADALTVSVHPKYDPSISAHLFSQADAENEEIQTVDSYHKPNTVHVKFKLEKKCAFGQGFSIVGDNAILGLWNPCNGVPLDWSEDHVWTVEMDLPIGKLIKYKFILVMDAHNILWQPGQDRLLKTCDGHAGKTIIVSEDWDDPELQNIVEEEELVRDAYEEPLISSDSPIVANGVSQAILQERTDDIEQLANTNGHANFKREPSEQMVAGNIAEDPGDQGVSYNEEETRDPSERGLSYNEKRTCLVVAPVKDLLNRNITIYHASAIKDENGSNLLHSKDEDEDWLITDDGVPVLVPCPVLLPQEQIEAADINHIATETELNEEHASKLSPVETQTMTADEKQHPFIKEQIEENNIFARKMQWGRITLQKFLANLGFE